MKTFTQFNEDIEQRRQQLRQRQLDQIMSHKEKVAEYQAERQRKLKKKKEREQIKQELKRELQTEQTPTMDPNLYSQQVARRQASQKSAHIKHVHTELGAEARAQQVAKNARMKAILSR